MIINDHSFSRQIVFGLEKIYDTFKSQLWDQSKKHGLRPLQIQVLLFVAGHGRKLNKVSRLSRELGVTKATMSETIRILEFKDLIEKQRDVGDSRSFAITLTRKGEAIIEDLESYQDPFFQLLSKIPEARKVSFYETLTGILHGLEERSAIILERHCYNCSNRKTDGARSFCMALHKQLPPEEIRLECPEHTHEIRENKKQLGWKKE